MLNTDETLTKEQLKVSINIIERKLIDINDIIDESVTTYIIIGTYTENNL